MQQINFDFNNCLLQKKNLKRMSPKISSQLDKLKYKSLQDKSDFSSVVLLPQDNSLLDEVRQVVSKKKSLHPELLIVIGIGGSNLGTMAVEQAVLDKYEYARQGGIKVLYA